MRRKDDAGAFYAFYDDLTKEKLGGFVKKKPPVSFCLFKKHEEAVPDAFG